MKIKNLLFLTVIAFGFISCKPSDESPYIPEIKAELEATSNSYHNAVKTVNVDSVTAFWTNDLQIYSHTLGEISGKEAFRELLEKSYHGLEIPEIRITSRELDVSEYLAVEVVEFTEIMIKDEGDPQTANGKYVAVWKKIDNRWKINKMVTLPTGKDEIQEQ